MKEIILLSTTRWIEMDDIFRKQLELDVLRLANHCLQRKLAGYTLQVIWYVNTKHIKRVLEELKESCSCPYEISIEKFHTLPEGYEVTDPTNVLQLHDQWQSDIECMVEKIANNAAIEVLAPNAICGLPIVYYGLEATINDLDVIPEHEHWYLSYSGILPHNYKDQAYTWLALLIGENDVSAYEGDDQSQQELFFEAAAFAMFLHGFEAIAEGQNYSDFDFDKVFQCFPVDLFYLAHCLDETGKELVEERIEEDEGCLSNVYGLALQNVLQNRAASVSLTVNGQPLTHGELFFVLWSITILQNTVVGVFVGRELQQAERFEKVLSSNLQLKLQAYSYVEECGLHMLNWD